MTVALPPRETCHDEDPPIDVEDGGGGGREYDDREPIGWVTVAAFFDDPVFAHLARIRLHAREIPCFVADEYIAGTAWHYALATGGTKVRVPREYAAEAVAVLAEPPDPAFAPALTSSEATRWLCPRCGSDDTSAGLWTARRIFGLIMVGFLGLSVNPIAGAVLPVFALVAVMTSHRRRCRQCAMEFDADARRGFEVIGRSKASDDAPAEDRP
jgi:hypothetical protein